MVLNYAVCHYDGLIVIFFNEAEKEAFLNGLSNIAFMSSLECHYGLMDQLVARGLITEEQMHCLLYAEWYVVLPPSWYVEEMNLLMMFE